MSQNATVLLVCLDSYEGQASSSGAMETHTFHTGVLESTPSSSFLFPSIPGDSRGLLSSWGPTTQLRDCVEFLALPDLGLVQLSTVWAYGEYTSTWMNSL